MGRIIKLTVTCCALVYKGGGGGGGGGWEVGTPYKANLSKIAAQWYLEEIVQSSYGCLLRSL